MPPPPATEGGSRAYRTLPPATEGGSGTQRTVPPTGESGSRAYRTLAPAPSGKTGAYRTSPPAPPGSPGTAGDTGSSGAYRTLPRDTAALRPVGLAFGQPLRATARRRGPIWTDRWAVLLAVLGLAANIAFAVVLWRQFENFPSLIALHYNSFGEADLITTRNEIYKLPLIGAIIWGSNAALAVGASPYDRVLARVVLAVAFLVELLLAAGAWRILT